MGNGLTELVFILDCSGSMNGYEADTVGGFNSVLKKQKKTESKAFVTTILFNHETKILHDRIGISDVEKMTLDDYPVSGCTALLDAVGDTIDHIKNIHKYIRKEDVPEHTLFVITTDGLENASYKYTASMVRKAIAQQKELGWEFLFLAADLDAEATAEHIGISRNKAANFHKDSQGIKKAFGAVASVCSSLPTRGNVADNWKKKLNEDFYGRVPESTPEFSKE